MTDNKPSEIVTIKKSLQSKGLPDKLENSITNIPSLLKPIEPEKDNIAYCVNQRNMLDIAIALIIAIAIIYFVIKKDNDFYVGDIGSMFQSMTNNISSGISSGVNAITSSGSSSGLSSSPKQVTATGLGSGQVGGFLKKYFK